jgi:hypothetical protein
MLGAHAEGEEVVEMPDPPNIDEVLKELDVAEELVNTFAVRAKRYWMGWGPVVGMPMILTIEAWTEGQRQYLNKWLRPRILEL